MAFNTNVKALTKEAKSIFKEGKDVLNSMDELNEWNSVNKIIANVDKVNNIILKVISAVEVAGENIKSDYEDIKSGEKLDAASQVLDDLIKLPWYLELVDGPALKIVISMAISLLNQTDGKKFDKDQAVKILKGELFPIISNVINK